MSYHMTLGALKCVKPVPVKGGTLCQQYTCTDPNERFVQSKTGPYCAKGGAGGSSISLPVAVSVSADGRITGSASVSTSTSVSTPKYTTSQPTTAAPASIPTPQAVKYGTLLWSDTHKIAAPATTYTKAPAKAVDYEAEAATAQASATRAAGMNWLPWALGAAGVVGIVLLVRRRA